jgi:CheY-like chemotaxis protein
LLDFALPVLRADQVCCELKASPKLRDIPVVIAGPALPPEFEALCRSAGASAYFPTPVDLEALATFLADLLGIPNREEPRLPVLLSVSHGSVTSQSLGRSRDLSLTGMQVRSSTRVQRGYSISLRFSLNETSPIVASGRVMRCTPTEEGEYDIGIRFTGVNSETRTQLADFLARHRS